MIDDAPASQPGPEGRPRAGRPRRPFSWGAALAIAAVGLVAGSAGGLLTHELQGGTPTPTPSVVATATPVAGAALSTAAIAARAAPAIVHIHVRIGQGPQSVMGAGSGIVLTADGQVLTNAHVIWGATVIQVATADGRVHSASVVGANRPADVALLQLDDASGLATADLGRSADVSVGDDVVAIGYALDLDGPPSVTRGIVSAVGRSFTSDGGAMTGLIQTDTAISSGSSGGALLNARGQVIGVTSMGATSTGGASAESVNFAVPIDTAMSLVSAMRAGQG